MTTRYPIVFEPEESGAVSAYVPDLPIYAAADSAAEAEQAVRELLALYLADRRMRELPLPKSRTLVKVARVTMAGGRSSVAIIGPSALTDRRRSPKKAVTLRRNGRRGRRPASAQRTR